MKANLSILVLALPPLLSIPSLATAEEAPFLYGDYSATVERSVNLAAPVETTALVSVGYPVPGQIRDTMLVGSYSPTIEFGDVHGR